MKTEQGFVLILTLCFISIISMLILSSMQHVLFYLRMINHHKEQQDHFYQAEIIIRQLATNPVATKCLSPEIGANKVIASLMNSHCIKDNYPYIIEDLGEFPCLVSKKTEHLVSTHHFRISLMVQNHGLLQIRTMQPTAQNNCRKQPKYITSGIHSWRYLVDKK